MFKPVRDVEAVTLQLVFLIVAIICFVVFTLAAHGTITTTEGTTWLGAGLVFFAAAHLPV